MDTMERQVLKPESPAVISLGGTGRALKSLTVSEKCNRKIHDFPEKAARRLINIQFVMANGGLT